MRALLSLAAAVLYVGIAAGPALAQESGTSVVPSPDPTTPVSVTPSSSSAAPSSTPVPSSTRPISTAVVVPATPAASTVLSTAARSSAARTSRTATQAEVIAPAVPVASTVEPPRATSVTYSRIAPWIPADDHPEILLGSVLLMAVSGGLFLLVWERRRD